MVYHGILNRDPCFSWYFKRSLIKADAGSRCFLLEFMLRDVLINRVTVTTGPPEEWRNRQGSEQGLIPRNLLYNNPNLDKSIFAYEGPLFAPRPVSPCPPGGDCNTLQLSYRLRSGSSRDARLTSASYRTVAVLVRRQLSLLSTKPPSEGCGNRYRYKRHKGGVLCGYSILSPNL